MTNLLPRIPCVLVGSVLVAVAGCAIGYDNCGNPLSLHAVGDFDGDGLTDIVVRSSETYVLLRQSAHGFGTRERIRGALPYYDPRGFAVADLNGDGAIDIIDLDAVVFGGDGAPFEEQPVPDHPGGLLVGLADVDGDGDEDLVSLSSALDGTNVVVARGDGEGRFDAPQESGSTHDSCGMWTKSALMDVDGDGAVDVLLECPRREIAMLRGDGSGEFEEAWVFGGGDTAAVGAGDFDGNGRVDLATTRMRTSDTKWCQHGRRGTLRIHTDVGPTGPSGAVEEYDVGIDPLQLAVGDLDGDGRDDIVVANHHGDEISVLLSAGGRRVVSLPGHGYDVSVADLDGDGDLDIVATTTLGHALAVAIHENTGSGEFAPRQVHVASEE